MEICENDGQMLQGYERGVLRHDAGDDEGRILPAGAEVTASAD
jgi:hypothetical protein